MPASKRLRRRCGIQDGVADSARVADERASREGGACGAMTPAGRDAKQKRISARELGKDGVKQYQLARALDHALVLS